MTQNPAPPSPFNAVALDIERAVKGLAKSQPTPESLKSQLGNTTYPLLIDMLRAIEARLSAQDQAILGVIQGQTQDAFGDAVAQFVDDVEELLSAIGDDPDGAADDMKALVTKVREAKTVVEQFLGPDDGDAEGADEGDDK